MFAVLVDRTAGGRGRRCVLTALSDALVERRDRPRRDRRRRGGLGLSVPGQRRALRPSCRPRGRRIARPGHELLLVAEVVESSDHLATSSSRWAPTTICSFASTRRRGPARGGSSLASRPGGLASSTCSPRWSAGRLARRARRRARRARHRARSARGDRRPDPRRTSGHSRRVGSRRGTRDARRVERHVTAFTIRAPRSSSACGRREPSSRTRGADPRSARGARRHFVDAAPQPDDALTSVHDPELVDTSRASGATGTRPGSGRPGQDRVVPYLFPHPDLFSGREPHGRRRSPPEPASSPTTP